MQHGFKFATKIARAIFIAEQEKKGNKVAETGGVKGAWTVVIEYNENFESRSK